MQSRKTKTMHKASSILLCLLLIALVGCIGGVTFDQYVNIPSDGWRRADIVKFSTLIRDSADYESRLAMRIEGTFPYEGVTVIVEEKISKGRKEIKTERDTITCDFIDKNGNIKSSGISRFEYDFPIAETTIVKGCRADVSIYHIMNVDTIPGITEIGFVMKKAK